MSRRHVGLGDRLANGDVSLTTVADIVSYECKHVKTVDIIGPFMAVRNL